MSMAASTKTAASNVDLTAISNEVFIINLNEDLVKLDSMFLFFSRVMKILSFFNAKILKFIEIQTLSTLNIY